MLSQITIAAGLLVSSMAMAAPGQTIELYTNHDPKVMTLDLEKGTVTAENSATAEFQIGAIGISKDGMADPNGSLCNMGLNQPDKDGNVADCTDYLRTNLKKLAEKNQEVIMAIFNKKNEDWFYFFTVKLAPSADGQVQKVKGKVPGF